MLYIYCGSEVLPQGPEVPGADPDTPRERNGDPSTTENLPRRWSKAERELCKPALWRLFKRLSIRLGGGQLIMSAGDATMGDSKAQLEAGCRVEASWQDARPAQTQDASKSEPTDSALRQTVESSSQVPTGTLQTLVLGHKRLAAGNSP